MLNRLKGSTCYLIGPMDYSKDRGAGWRKNITPFLHSLGIGVFSPTDKATTVGLEDADHINDRHSIIQAIKDTTDQDYHNKLYDQYHEIMRDIVATDLRMVDSASFLIMYVNLNTYACGTYHESSMAILQRKPVIVMCEQGKVNTPPWLIGICKHEMIFDSWEQVKEYIRHIDQDEKVDTLNRWRFYNYDKVFGR